LSGSLPGLTLSGGYQSIGRDTPQYLAGDALGPLFGGVPTAAHLVKVVVPVDVVDGGSFALLGKHPIRIDFTHGYCVRKYFTQ
jgi:hypothetical protein